MLNAGDETPSPSKPPKNPKKRQIIIRVLCKLLGFYVEALLTIFDLFCKMGPIIIRVLWSSGILIRDLCTPIRVLCRGRQGMGSHRECLALYIKP